MTPQGQRLGMEVVATDIDQDVLDLLQTNAERNAPGLKGQLLAWGEDHGGLEQPDVLLVRSLFTLPGLC